MILNESFFLKSIIIVAWESFCKKHDFELKVFRHVRFRIKFFPTSKILNQNFYNVSDFKKSCLQRFRFRIEYFIARQILSVLFSQFAKILCVEYNKARVDNVWKYSVASVSHVILLG